MGLFTPALDKETYLAFITSYKATMYRIAYGYLGRESAALDAVDEAVYQGYIHRRQLKERDYLKTWLTRILINECLRLLKTEKRFLPLDSLPDFPEKDTEVTLPTRMAVQSLPEELRQVIVLRYFADHTLKETAKLLSLPEGTVATRARKALTLLRVELADEEGGISHETR